jgi:hypothetical protein
MAIPVTCGGENLIIRSSHVGSSAVPRDLEDAPRFFIFCCKRVHEVVCLELPDEEGVKTAVTLLMRLSASARSGHFGKC